MAAPSSPAGDAREHGGPPAAHDAAAVLHDHLAPLLRSYRQAARDRLHPDVWHYLADGEGDGNEAALAAARIMPRPLADVRGGSTSISLFGQQLDHPLLLAPVAYQRLFHPDGEAAGAMAAAAQGGQFIVSSLASQPVADIVRAADQPPGRAPWFQLYWQGDRDRTLRLLQRARAAGSGVIVFTVDAPVKVASLQLPAGVQAVNLEEGGVPRDGGASRVFDGWMAQAPTWDDLAWLRTQVEVPLLVKGVLHPDDAERAVAFGCDGVIVSSHGGRVMRGAPASLPALRRVADRIGGRVPVLFDSGIRSGRDAFVALAHGAAAVLVGRPYVWGLAADGAMGVARTIRVMRDEIELAMALAGCRAVQDIGAACLADR